MDTPVARASADLRLLRAAVFTAVCVALSAGAHTLGGDARAGGVPLWTLGLAAVVVFAVAAPLAGRERALPGIAAGLAGGQLALHGLFSFGEALSRPKPAADGQRIVELARTLLCNDGMAHGLTLPRARQLLEDAGLGHLTRPAGPTVGTHAEHGAASAATTGELSGWDAVSLSVHGLLGTLTTPMMLGHLAAALTLGVLLRRGEAALWRLVRLSAVAVDELLFRALRDVLHWARTRRDDQTDGPRTAGSPAYVRLFVPVEAESLRHCVIRRGPPYGTDDFELTA